MFISEEDKLAIANLFGRLSDVALQQAKQIKELHERDAQTIQVITKLTEAVESIHNRVVELEERR